MTNGPPPGAFERPFPTACQRIREGPLAFKIRPSLASRPHRDATIPAKPGAHPILTVNDSKPFRTRHFERRSTAEQKQAHT